MGLSPSLSGGRRLSILPPCIGRLPALKRLNLRGCEKLTSLGDELPRTLCDLVLNDCYELACLPPVLSSLTDLSALHLNRCESLVAIPPVGKLKGLTQLSLIGCGGLEGMPSGLQQLIGCCVSFDDGDVVVGAEGEASEPSSSDCTYHMFRERRQLG